MYFVKIAYKRKGLNSSVFTILFSPYIKRVHLTDKHLFRLKQVAVPVFLGLGSQVSGVSHSADVRR